MYKDSEMLNRYSTTAFLADGDIQYQTIENPERALADNHKDAILSQASQLLAKTTGIATSNEEIRRYLFGIANRGRILNLFWDKDLLIGYFSFHLINTNELFVRVNESTILHAGSCHILPFYQGRHLWEKAGLKYIAGLPHQLRPRYISGFTQSPRLLKLAMCLTHNRVSPNPISTDNPLDDIHDQIMEVITQGFGEHTTLKDNYVVCGMSNRIYASRVYSRDKTYDDFFYSKLNIIPEDGDLVHLLAEIA